MGLYNIVYTSEDGATYLWNGSGFDELHHHTNDRLFFSGKAYMDDELAAVLQKARRQVSESFPGDKTPRVDPVEVPVNDKDTDGGHHGRMTT